MSTNLESTAASIDAICSKINADLSAIAAIEIECVKNTATSFIAATNALLGKSATTESTVAPTAAKPKVRSKKRKSKAKAAAIAAGAIEKAAVAEADIAVATAA